MRMPVTGNKTFAFSEKPTYNILDIYTEGNVAEAEEGKGSQQWVWKCRQG